MNVKMVRKVLITASFQSRVHFLRDQGKWRRSPTSGEIGDLLSQRGNRAFRGRIKPLASTTDYHQNKRFFAARNLNGFTPLALTTL
jgi:hypothetical protein